MDVMPHRPDIIRLLTVVGVRLYREGLSSALRQAPTLAVVGEVADARLAGAAIAGLRPDVVMVDVALPDGLDLVRRLARESPQVHVIAFAVSQTSADIIACAEAGAAGYVTADASIDQLVAAVTGVVSGELICPPKIAHDLFRRLGGGDVRAGRAEPALTEREAEVLQLLRSGLSNKEIARVLRIALSTVKNHVHHILEKLEASSRSQAASRFSRASGTPHRDLEAACLSAEADVS